MCRVLREALVCYKITIPNQVYNITTIRVPVPRHKKESCHFTVRIELHLKDITNAMETANEMQIPLQVTSNLHQVLKSLVLDGKGVDDHSGILKFVEKQSGVEVKK